MIGHISIYDNLAFHLHFLCSPAFWGRSYEVALISSIYKVLHTPPTRLSLFSDTLITDLSDELPSPYQLAGCSTLQNRVLDKYYTYISNAYASRCADLWQMSSQRGSPYPEIPTRKWKPLNQKLLVTWQDRGCFEASDWRGKFRHLLSMEGTLVKVIGGNVSR